MFYTYVTLKFFEYIIHAIWQRDDYVDIRVPAVLFHVIRLCLILSFVSQMEGFKRLPIATIEAINSQTRWVVLYYSELLIYIINGEDEQFRFTGREQQWDENWKKVESSFKRRTTIGPTGEEGN